MLRLRGVRAASASAVIGLMAPLAIADAQHDYFNTDVGRPGHIEDAIPIERRAVELHVAPLRFEGERGRGSWFGMEPGLSIGILARTQVDLVMPLVLRDGTSNERPRPGVAAVGARVLHALNAETLGWPALAIGAGALLPTGTDAGSLGTVTAIVTRTLSFARMHLNASYTLGRTRTPDIFDLQPRSPALLDLARWGAGVAFDRAFPLASTMVLGEALVQRSIDPGRPLAAVVNVGARRQLSARWTGDASVGRRFTEHRNWSFTLGTSFAFGIVPRATRPAS